MEKRSDWVLIVLFLAGKKGLTPAQLQKTLFLLKKNILDVAKLDYDFQPYNYGPFDVEVYRDAEGLASNGLCKIYYENGHNWGSYHITSNGMVTAKEKIKEIKPNIKNYLEQVISWVQSISFQKLIGAIYNKYPEYKVNSIFKD